MAPVKRVYRREREGGREGRRKEGKEGGRKEEGNDGGEGREGRKQLGYSLRAFHNVGHIILTGRPFNAKLKETQFHFHWTRLFLFTSC